jgi:hypothetical protein
MSRQKGGLGIKDIRTMNACLLCKWRWKVDNETGIWQDIMKAKYLSKAVLGNVTHKLDDSPIWCDLQNVNHLYMKRRTCKIQSGETVLFWLDRWSKDGPLCTKQPILFELCDEKEITVKKFIELGCDLNLEDGFQPS